MSSNDRSIDRTHVSSTRETACGRVSHHQRTRNEHAFIFLCHIFSHSDTRLRVFIFSLIENPAQMPPRRLTPGEGAKYQNAVAYKADLHVKTSESAQKLLASLKNQALQNICKRCREKIECALFVVVAFAAANTVTCAYAFRVFGLFVVVVVVVVGWVSPARARARVSLFFRSQFLYLSLPVCVCVCSSRRAIETRIHTNSHAQLTFSLAHTTHTHTQRKIQAREIQVQKKRALTEMTKL